MSAPSCRERDQALLKRMRNGDEAAFEQLFRAYYEDLCQFATRYLSSTEEIEDLVQEIFVSVWKRRQALDPQQSIRGYLYSATRNEALKHLNQKKRQFNVSDTQQAFQERSLRGSPEKVLRNKELETEAQEALRALPERRREIFLLSRQHGLTYAEIAELLNISIKTVETQMGRALSTLEEHFSALLPS